MSAPGDNDGPSPNQDEPRLAELVRQYLRLERVAEHRQQVQRLAAEGGWPELEQLLGSRLTFGTAGIRGRMGAGFSQMNDLVIIQTSQGLASYLIELHGLDRVRQRGVIIGNDARHNSARFARLATLAFLQKQVPVYLCERPAPTPLIAFGVRRHQCLAGVVVTASHNPKQDNGYKVYGANGAQIMSPHDKRIQAHIVAPENAQPWRLAWRLDLLTAPALLGADAACAPVVAAPEEPNRDPAPDPAPPEWAQLLAKVHNSLASSYLKYLDETFVGARRRQLNQSSELRLVHTAMHGVGHAHLAAALAMAGFRRALPVAQQMEPDPEFPTVSFPNPEEAGALELAFEAAERAQATLVLANDPDADRCAAAELEPATGRRRPFTGDELGCLLGWWAWHCERARPAEEAGPLAAAEVAPGGRVRTASQSASSEETAAAAPEDKPPGETSTGEFASDKQVLPGRGRRPLEPAAGDDTAFYMISTAVSSRFLASMGAREGFEFCETLTGFKHMANLADELQRQPAAAAAGPNQGGRGRRRKALFAYEEAIGYMCNAERVLDKDGLSAGLQVAQLAVHLRDTYGRTLEQQLDFLHGVYGYHYSRNSYFVCRQPSLVDRIFGELRANYPSEFVWREPTSSPPPAAAAARREDEHEDEAANEDEDDERRTPKAGEEALEAGGQQREREETRFQVKRVRDLRGPRGLDTAQPDQRPTLPLSDSSHMTTFFVDSDITFTVRTSGTEPKIKFYSEIVAKLPPLSDRALQTNDFSEPAQLAAKLEARCRLERFLEAALERCLRARELGLEAAPAAQ